MLTEFNAGELGIVAPVIATLDSRIRILGGHSKSVTVICHRNLLAELQQAIAGGVPVIGYLHWSLLDNFEWQQGYGPKYGLASVDSQTFKRTLKPSAAVYRAIVRANAV